MPRPTQPVVDWSTVENDESGNPLKILPPPEIQATGVKKGQPVGRQWLNYVLNNHSEWLKYLSTPLVGEVRSYNVQKAELLTQGWKLASSVVGTAQTTTKNLYTYEYVG